MRNPFKKKPVVNQEIYQLPLSCDDNDPSIVWTSNEVRAFDFWDRNQELFPTAILTDQWKQVWVDVINDKPIEILSFITRFEYDNGQIYVHGTIHGKRESFMTLRGWGHLTGTLSLRVNEAKQAQDKFGELLAKKLNAGLAPRSLQ